MSPGGQSDCTGSCRDVRQRGFAGRVPVEQAIAWIDAHAAPSTEAVNAAESAGRVLAAPVRARIDLPPFDSVVADGYALRSSETVGASDYNPRLFSLQNAALPLPPMAAALVSAGMALPEGADTVLPFEASSVNGATLEVYRAVAAGVGIECKGQQFAAGTTILDRGKILRPQDIGAFISASVEHVEVIRSPRVRLVIAGPKSGTPDADTSMLRALLSRDGGVVESIAGGAGGRESVRKAIASPGADAILVVGRTGTGADDEAPLAVADSGDLDIHGVALRPGGSTGMGSVGGVPVLLLPGEPLACFCAYELFAGRLVRQLGGRSPEFLYAVRKAEVRRKIVSAVGVVDLCQVRFASTPANQSSPVGVEPVSSAESAGLVSAVRGDGFVLIPAALEGFAPGAQVSVFVY